MKVLHLSTIIILLLATFIEAKSIDLKEFNENTSTADNGRARPLPRTPDLKEILSSPLIKSILSDKTIEAVLTDPMVNKVFKNPRVQKVLTNPIVNSVLMSNSVDDIKGISLIQLLLSRMSGIDQKNVPSLLNRPVTLMNSVISSIDKFLEMVQQYMIKRYKPSNIQVLTVKN